MPIANSSPQGSRRPTQVTRVRRVEEGRSFPKAHACHRIARRAPDLHWRRSATKVATVRNDARAKVWGPVKLSAAGFIAGANPGLRYYQESTGLNEHAL